MIYRGYFRDVLEVLYEVNIITDNDESVEASEELMFTDNPVTIKYTSDDENAYKPYKCSTSTISLLLRENNFDLNNAFANRVKVIIYKGNLVIWCGYATPNAYSQSYEDYYDLYELDCQDALSTLKYFDYLFKLPVGDYPVGVINYSDPYKDKLVSDHNYCINLLNLIVELNRRIDNSYLNIYVSDSIIIEGLRLISCLDAVFIDEKNFFDEDGKGWNCLEIIEEICKYLGLTCIPFGDSLYFINQDAIVRGYNEYFMYSYEGNKLVSRGKVELQDELEIVKESFSRNGTNISLGSIYNKAVVQDDLYAVDTLVPDIEDRDYWVESEVSNYREPNDGNEYKWDDDTWTNSVLSDNTIVLRNNTGGKHWVYLKHYGYDYIKNPNKRYILRYYRFPIISGDTIDLQHMIELPMMGELDVPYRDFSYGFTRENIGAEIIEYGTREVDDWDDIVSSVDYKKAILLHFPVDPAHITSSDYHSFNLFTILGHGIKPLFECITDSYFMAGNSYIVLQGKLTFSWFPEVLPFMSNDTDTKSKSINSFVWCKLLVGNKWLVNINQATDSLGLKDYRTEWSSTEGYFKLPLEFKKDTGAFNTAVSFKNTVEENMHFEEDGFAIKCPVFGDENEGTTNKVKFTMMIPHGIAPIEIENPVTSTRAALLEDFDIKVCNATRLRLNDSDDNTEITNDMVSGAVEEYENISLKICTNQDKKLNLSQTFYLKGVSKPGSVLFTNASYVNSDSMISSYKIEDLLRYTGSELALMFGNVKMMYNTSKESLYTPELNIIANIVELYSSPTLSILCNLKNSLDLKPYSVLTYPTLFPGYRFCIDRMSYSLADNIVKLNIISKKYEYNS